MRSITQQVPVEIHTADCRPTTGPIRRCIERLNPRRRQNGWATWDWAGQINRQRKGREPEEYRLNNKPRQ